MNGPHISPAHALSDVQLSPEDLYHLTVSELVWSESKFVQGLGRLCSLKQLAAAQASLDTEAIDQVFGASDDILQIHSRFLDRLQDIAALPDEKQRWANVFSTFDDARDVYVPYIANYKGRLCAAIRHQGNLSSVTGPEEVAQQVSDVAAIHHTFQWSFSRFAKYSCILNVRAIYILVCINSANVVM